MGPQVREMLQSPYMRQMLTNPDMMRQVRQMMQGGGMGGFGGGQAGGAQWPPPGAFETPAAGQGQRQEGAGAGAGAGTGAGATTGTGTGGAQQPPFNPFAAFGGAGGQQPGAGFDPMAFMNTPLGQQAMQQMMQGGGPGAGMGGLGGMFGGMGGAGGGESAAPSDTRSPEERFETQLGQLASMGFTVRRHFSLHLSFRG